MDALDAQIKIEEMRQKREYLAELKRARAAAAATATAAATEAEPEATGRGTTWSHVSVGSRSRSRDDEESSMSLPSLGHDGSQQNPLSPQSVQTEYVGDVL